MLIELVKTIAKGKLYSPKYQFLDVVSRHFRVMPWHIDFNMHINNANYLVFMEKGRWDHSAQTGVINPLVKRRVNLIVAGIEIGYFRELNLFQRFTLKTKFTGWDEKYLYIEQRFVRGGKVYSTGLAKVVFVKGGKTLVPAEIFSEIGLPMPDMVAPDYVNTWKTLNVDKRTASEQDNWD